MTDAGNTPPDNENGAHGIDTSESSQAFGIQTRQFASPLTCNLAPWSKEGLPMPEGRLSLTPAVQPQVLPQCPPLLYPCRGARLHRCHPRSAIGSVLRSG